MPVALYAAVGPDLTQYALDVETAALTPRGAIRLPADVHYAWPHASRRFLYVASSDGAPGNGAPGNGAPGRAHHVTALRIAADGRLARHGEPIMLPARPIHLATDLPSRHLLVAFNNPAALRVYRIREDATPGEEVRQAAVDPGIYPHQVRPTPDGRQVILVARGNDARAGRPEEPGALKLFAYADGRLDDEVSIAPDGGYGFGPRHLDFHPSQPWVFVSLERQNGLAVFSLVEGRLSAAPLFTATTLTAPRDAAVHQIAGTVHVHPNGRLVYVANRASTTVAHGGREVLAGGENSLAVYEIDGAAGQPRLIQSVDSGGVHCRTFHIDPSGRVLVAAHIAPMAVRSGATIAEVPARLSVFRIGGDGRLDPARSYDVDVGGRTMFWMGMVPNPD